MGRPRKSALPGALGRWFRRDDPETETLLRYPEEQGLWSFDEDDYLLLALLCDPIYCAELLWEDPSNHEYAGMYVVRDYQYPLFRGSRDAIRQALYAGFACGRSVGKALAEDEHVLTPAGWRTMADIEVGDMVVGSDGMPTPVVGSFPQGERDLFRVTFDDGSTVDCDDEHLWTVTCDHWQSRKTGPKTITLREVRSRAATFKTPLVGPVEFMPRAPYPISPWLVGMLIGDGNLTRPTMIRLATVDEEIVDRVAAELPADMELVHDGGCNYRLRNREYVSAGYRKGRVPGTLLAWARESGMQGKSAHEKRVPHELLWGSTQERLEVLRGLVDSDGSVTHAASIEICTASEGLADDIAHLVKSLGGRCSITRAASHLNGVRYRDRFRVVFRLEHDCPCWLPRKANAYVARSAARTRDTAWRKIKTIEPIGRRAAKCIKVAAADGLFVTRGFVVTHNTESVKARAFTHIFRRIRQNLLLTAPELIHLLPLTDAIEDKVRNVRLTRDFLDLRGGKTGFTHRPFGIDLADGTKIVGRIPRLSGTGVKGQHQPDLIVDEAQDYPEAGWIEVHETVMKDTVDLDGNPDFTYHFYGVHSGARDSGFFKRSSEGAFEMIQVTAIQRPGWSKQEKEAAKAAYGGTGSPDYRRNILGEAGAASSAFFVTSRLVACIDQDRESVFNRSEYKHQEVRAEEFDALKLPMSEVLDLPSGLKTVFGGMDVGLTNSPTVIMLFSKEKVGKAERLKLVRRIHLVRMRPRQIRQAMYAIGWHFGDSLKGFGMDVTGLGLPIWQDMEDDENCPANMRPAHEGGVARGYFFNAKVPVGVDKAHVSEDGTGRMKDQYGAAVKEEYDPMTGQMRYVVMQPMIEASTRYLREFVDQTTLLLPFDTAITSDMQGETQQRVRRLSGLKQKPNAFHILDGMRAAAMVMKAEEVDAQMAMDAIGPVLDMAL